MRRAKPVPRPGGRYGTVGSGAPEPESSAWIVRPDERPGAALRLFCFPYAGGSAAMYQRWPRGVSVEVEVCAVELPGRGRRFADRLVHDFFELVVETAEGVAPMLGPRFAFFGHSMGALVSFELARAMRREFGVTAEHLFVSAWRAPQLPLGSALHRLPEMEFVERLQARFSGIPEGVLRDREIMDMMLPVPRADLAVCETYSYASDEPFDCPITVLGGHEDHWVNAAELAAWTIHSSHSTNVEMFPGDHFFINDARQLVPTTVSRVLADLIAE